MTQTSFVKPLGEVLLQTGLISAEQIEEALAEQARNSTLKIGEILARHGWLKQETANFFAERWPRYVSQRRKQPLGQYLRDASLLNLAQVKSILQEQTGTETRFGELIVNKGWLSQETIDFFLHSMDDERDALDAVDPPSNSSSAVETLGTELLRNQQCNPYQLLLIYQKALWHPLTHQPDHREQTELLSLGLLVKQDPQLLVANPKYQTVFNTSWVDQELGNLRPFEKVRVNLFKLDEKASLPFTVLEEVFVWTGREPFLTQALCHAIYDFGDFIPANEETEQVAHIVQKYVIQDWRNNVAATHFQKIYDQLQDASDDIVEVLTRYQQILREKESSVSEDDPSLPILKDVGLVIQKQEQLQVSNRIYEAVFDEQWVTDEIERQRNPQTPKSSELIVAPSREVVLLPSSDQETKSSTGSSTLWPLMGKVLLGLLLVGVIGTLVTIFAQRVSRNQTATRSFDQANELLNQGKHEDAIAQYNEVLNIDGNYHQAWTNRGYAFAGTGNFSQMLSSCRSATIIDPQAIYAWNCQGEALHNLQQFEEAIAAFDQAIELDPSDPVFWINKSESLLASEQFEPALNASQTAIENLKAIEAEQLDSSSVKNELSIAWGMKGRVFQKEKRYSEALNAYKQALVYNASYFPAQLGKGITLKNLEQYDDANTQFERALKLDLSTSQQAEVWFYSGLTHCKLRQTDEALVAYDNALDLKPDFEAAETARWNNCS